MDRYAVGAATADKMENPVPEVVLDVQDVVLLTEGG